MTERAFSLSRFAAYGLMQRKLLARPYSGWMHVFISTSFLALFLGSLLLQIDQYVLKPRDASFLRGHVYQILQAALDVFGLLLVLGILMALYRRMWAKPESVQASRQIDLILVFLLCIAVSGFLLEGLRMSLESTPYQAWAFAGRAVAGLIEGIQLSNGSGLLLYRITWWVHALAAFGLIAAIPYTHLIHLLMSPLNILVSSPRPRGDLKTPFNLKELMETGQFDVKVGAGAISDFDWKERLGLAACTNCGRCQEICPAHATGTALSPRRLVQNLKETAESPRRHGNRTGDLFEGVVSENEVWACTLCGACTHACPVLIHPHAYIVELRRELVARNRLGAKTTEMLANLSRTFNPYGAAHSDRSLLSEQLGVQTLSENPEVEWLYWVGCAGTYDPRARRIVEATLDILRRGNVRFGILGAEERCTGDPARRIGEEGRFQELVFQNLETLERYGVKNLVTHCAHCFNTLRNEYPHFGARFKVAHHTTLIHELIDGRRIQVARGVADRATLHDSCYIGRFNGGIDTPREILRSIPGLNTTEMANCKNDSFCCGAGGGSYWYESEIPRKEKMSSSRIRQAQATGARVLVAECPFCMRMFEECLKTSEPSGEMVVRDIAEIVAEAMG